MAAFLWRPNFHKAQAESKTRIQKASARSGGARQSSAMSVVGGDGRGCSTRPPGSPEPALPSLSRSQKPETQAAVGLEGNDSIRPAHCHRPPPG